MRETSIDAAAADLARTEAIGVLQGITGQTLMFVAGDVFTARAGQARQVFLPELPVADVTSVESAPIDVWTTVGADYTWTTNGVVSLPTVRPGTPVRVTYDHGYATTPFDLKHVALKVAAAVYSSQSTAGVQAKSVTVGAYSESTTYSAQTASAGILDELDMRILTRYAVPFV